jgi:hypothetical protein
VLRANNKSSRNIIEAYNKYEGTDMTVETLKDSSINDVNKV